MDYSELSEEQLEAYNEAKADFLKWLDEYKPFPTLEAFIEMYAFQHLFEED